MTSIHTCLARDLPTFEALCHELPKVVSNYILMCVCMCVCVCMCACVFVCHSAPLLLSLPLTPPHSFSHCPSSSSLLLSHTPSFSLSFPVSLILTPSIRLNCIAT